MGETKVTRGVFQDNVKSLLEKAASSGGEPTDIVVEVLSFLRDNYSNMTPEMEALADKIIDASIESADQAMKTAPDTKETRAAKLLLRTLKQGLPSAQSLIMSMERRLEIADPIVTEPRVVFEKYFQAFLDAVYDVSIERTQSGTTSFAILGILFSCVDELVAGFHLAQHAYVNQAHTHIRSVFESLNMVQLFLNDPSYADLWCSDEKKRIKQKLSPAAVRDKLGIKDDLIYRFLSTYGPHPTFEYVRSKSARKAGLSAGGKPEIHFFLGGTRITGHILSANFNCILALLMALSLVGKAFPDSLHQEDYMEILKNAASDWKSYLLRCIEFFKEAGQDTSEIEAYLKTLDYLF